MRLLLARGAILNALNVRDRTALHEAAARASTIGNMRVLLDAGANPNAVAGLACAKTPRELAVSHPEGPDAAALIPGYRGTQELLSKPIDLLTLAAGSGHPDTVRLLIARGTDPTGGNRWGYSSLHAAVRADNLKTMRVLLEHGADPNYPTSGRDHAMSRNVQKPLHEAIRNPRSVALLLEAGADPDGRMSISRRRTPLHLAAKHCEASSLALLLAGGADPNAGDRDGQTPLHRAVYETRNLKTVPWSRTELLAACAAKATEGERKNCRLLAAARFKDWHEARHRCLGNIATLLRHGADPGVGAEVGSENDVTPLDLARRFGLDKTLAEMKEDALPQARR